MKLISLFLFIILSCTNSKTNLSEDIFKYDDGVKKIEFQFSGSNDFLELNKTSDVKIIFENIDVGNIIVSSKGKEFVSADGSSYLLKLTPKKEELRNNHVEVKIYEFTEKYNVLIHKFALPVKGN
jgi:hypothetical protein